MSDLISDPPTMKVDVITEQGRAEARVCDLTDAQLENAIGNVAADLALAEKYEHNAHLRPAIRAHFDMLDAERKRRGSSAEPAPPTMAVCETTSTPRLPRSACSCNSTVDDMGPCENFQQGASGNCVYCEHTLACHMAAHKCEREPAPVQEEARLQERITAYLSLGGLFNPEMANHDAVQDHLILDLREALAGSISERETLTAQNEELKKQRDDAFHHASENVDDVKTAYETACDDLHEANETIARLTSRAVEASPSEFQKFCIACGRTLPDENEQLFAWREQAIQDIEALSRYGASSRFPFCEHAHGEYINREAVLLILREAPTT